ncbi:hypothetical protein BGX28_007992 [Mortierella sp. GBA30]|nr:hypothetical protein BGX28_007992 [Mortierella sp. GBA30]
MSSSQFQEDYALNPASRAQLLKTATPGTEEYHLYRLRYMSQQLQTAELPVTTQTIDEAMALLDAAENSNVVSDFEQLNQLKTQIALLAFPVKPEILHKELAYDHGMQNVAQGEDDEVDGDAKEVAESADDGVKKLPSALDQTLFSTETLTEKLLNDIEQRSYSASAEASPHLLAQPRIESILDQLDDDALCEIFHELDFMYSPKSLEILSKADTSRIDQVVVKIIVRLYQEKKLDFTEDDEWSTNLTRAQLEAIKKELPQVMNDESFVGALENRIIPEHAPEHEEIAYQNWLDKMTTLVDELSPKFNRHKLSVYLLSLENDLSKGIADKAKFLRYVAIPRSQSQYNQKTLKSFERDVPVRLDLNQRLAHWSPRVSAATTERDDVVVKEYLSRFMCEAKSSAEFEEYFELKTFLHPLFARAMLFSGDKDSAKWSTMLPKDESLTQLTEQTIFKFAPDNQAKFLPADNVVFKLRAKNAKQILVRVFEVKTFEYIQQYGDSVMGQNLNLDGLTPNWEHNLVLDHPPIEMHEIMVELPELANRRGAFVMDVISNGENSSAYFTKGFLDFIETRSVAGHVLTIVDENKERVSEKCSVWLNGYHYKPNADGDITVPYRKPTSSSTPMLYLIHDGFATRRHFDHLEEEYVIKLACHIDHESFVAGSTAKIVIKPTVLIGGNTVVCPVSLLEQVQLTITSTDTNHINTTKTVSDFKIHDVEWSEYNFQVPPNLSSFYVSLSAKIKVISTGEYLELSASRTFAFESPLSDQIVSFSHNGQWGNKQVSGEVLTLLRQNTDGYRVFVFGKNGEVRSNVPLEFAVKHAIYGTPLEVYLRSDDNGEIFLGPLQDVDQLHCKTTGLKWSISGRDRYVYPSNIHSIEGDIVSLPLATQDFATIRKIALHSMSGPEGTAHRCVLDDFTNNIRLQDGLLSIKGLKAGYYSFRIGNATKCRLVVAALSATKAKKIEGLEEFLVGSNPMLELSGNTKAPFHMSQPAVNSQKRTLDIQLHNWTEDTRLCIIATKFLPLDGMVFENLKVLDSERPWAMAKIPLTATSFQTGRVLGEEYQYVLNRKAQSTHWAGNLLTKPSVLLSPWSIADTTMSKESMQAEQRDNMMNHTLGAGAVSMDPRLFYRTKQSARKCTGGASFRLPPLLNFFAHPSIALVNLKPDSATGLVSLPLSAFMETTFLQVFAVDGRQAVQRSMAVPQLSSGALGFQKRDLRFRSSQDHAKHYIAERTGVDLDPRLHPTAPVDTPSSGMASVTLASDLGSHSSVKVINSVSQVYDLMLTLLENEEHKQNLSKFSFVKEWHRFTNEVKKEKYSNFNCHELNLFLFKKDRVFFDAVVSPYLKNKLKKSFIDDYLLGASLEKYVALDQFSLLTCMEKCLLAQRIPVLRPAVVRWIKDRVHSARAASNIKLFQTVMKSGNLKESDPADGGPKSVAYSPTSPAYSPQYKIAAETDEASDFEMVESAPMLSYSAAPMSMPQAEAVNVREGAMQFRSAIAGARGMFQQQSRAQSERILQRQFKPVELTKEMAETYYYGRQDYKTDDNEEANMFWLDLAEWDESKGGSFLSQNFVANARSFTSAMATIALLDVSFRPKEASLERTTDRSVIVSSLSPAIVFHSSTKELSESPITGSVLVTQQYFEQGEKEEYDEVLRTHVRKYIQSGAEFRPLESYGAHVVLMNATPNPMRVHLDLQIPQGAISIYGDLEPAQDIKLAAHGTYQYEYGFYFPEQGDFPHYPAHVSNYEDIIAYAPASVLKVRIPELDQSELMTANSWSHILKRGTKDDILKKLASSPLSSLPEDLLLGRLYKDKKFLQQVTSVLRSRQEFSEKIWSTSLMSQHLELVKEYLMNKSPSALNVGEWFTSSIFARRPRTRFEGSWDRSYRYLEYFPLINARAHKANRNATILNDKFKIQYYHFLQLLSQKPYHDVDDLLVLIVYLLAQDRILEAKHRFQQLSELMSKTEVETQGEFFQQLQYDYLRAYLSLCVEVQVDSSASAMALDLAGVQQILNKYRDYPVERWSKMFKDMQQYVDEIEQSMKVQTTEPHASQSDGSVPVPEKDETEGEDDTVDVPVTADFKIGSESMVTIRHRGVREVTVEYYSIDAETMFSDSPLTFSDQGESESSSSSVVNKNEAHSYRLVKPNGVDTHTVKRAVQNDGILMIPILPQYLNTNVMISVRTSPPAATQAWKAYYSQTIVLQCVEQTGILRVISKSDGRPIRGGYVKVYAEMKQGSSETVFWKDGYTDLVGRFAYAQVSTATVAAGSLASASRNGGLADVKRFAVFVDGGREGCVVKTLPVPPV